MNLVPVYSAYSCSPYIAVKDDCFGSDHVESLSLMHDWVHLAWLQSCTLLEWALSIPLIIAAFFARLQRQFVWKRLQNSLSADRGFLLPISGGSNLLAVYSANASAVVLAFGGTNETIVNVTASNPLESDAFYKGAFSNQGNGSVDPYLADPFYGRIGGGYDGLYRVRC